MKGLHPDKALRLLEVCRVFAGAVAQALVAVEDLHYTKVVKSPDYILPEMDSLFRFFH